jgi:hypothetical protein
MSSLPIWELPWEKMLASLGVLGAMWALGILVLSKSFVTHNEFAALSARMKSVEVAMQNVATAVDVRGLSDRCFGIEGNVKMLTERSGNTGRGVDRVEHQLGLLMKSLLEREGAG